MMNSSLEKNIDLKIEELNESHLDDIKKWGVHKDPLLWEYNISNLTRYELGFWLIDRRRTYKTAYYVVLDEDRVIGYFGFRDINTIFKTATLGLALDPNITSKGYGSVIMEMLLHYFFEEMKMNILNLEVNRFNTRAINLYKKFSFEEIENSYISYEIQNQNLEILNDPRYFFRKYGRLYSKTIKMRLERDKYNEI